MERLGFLGSHGRTVWMIQITHSHKSGLAEILSLAQMFLKNMCPLVTFPFICFSSMLRPIVLLRSRKKKEGNCVTLFGTLEKSQTLQEPGSETDFAELNVLCIMAAPLLLMFLFSWKISVSLSGKMKFFGGKLFLSGRTTHSNRKSSTR